MEWFFSLLTDNPVLRAMQFSLLGGSVVAIYLVFYATRDILLRTRSLAYQLACILLVACLPVLGFFLYLLVRPSTTIRERAVDEMVRKMFAKENKDTKSAKAAKDSPPQL